MAGFLVQAAFPNHAEQYFVVAGQLLEGTVTPDMCIMLPFSSALGRVLQIEAIEIVRRTDDAHTLALCIRYGSEEQLRALQSLELQGEMIEIRHCPTQTRALAPLQMFIDDLQRFFGTG